MKNIRSYSVRELQLRTLPLLEAFHRVCHEHGLRYYAAYGTLLGAVREGGFIPWDDDADLVMPRADYESLVEHAEDWVPAPYRIVTHANDPHYPKYFAKFEDTSTTVVENPNLGYVGGLYIDIFVVDGVSSNALRRRYDFARFFVLRRLLYFAYRNPYKHGRGPSCWVPLLVQRLVSRDWLHRAIRRVQRSHSHGSTLVTIFDALPRIYPAESFGKPVPVRFENLVLDAPNDAARVLTGMYGPSYMTPPPERQRRSHNHYYCDFDTPYAEYEAQSGETRG